MKRGLAHVVVGMLIMLIGAGPACACSVGGMMPAKAGAAAVKPVMHAMPAMAEDHACCMTSEKPDNNAQQAPHDATNDAPHDASCPHCQAMTTSVKAVQDHQTAATWGSLHLVATVPVTIAMPAVGAINVALFSPVWSPPLLLDDLFHSFCLLTV